jgi:hypothetical protein
MSTSSAAGGDLDYTPLHHRGDDYRLNDGFTSVAGNQSMDVQRGGFGTLEVFSSGRRPTLLYLRCPNVVDTADHPLWSPTHMHERQFGRQSEAGVRPPGTGEVRLPPTISINQPTGSGSNPM